MSKKLTEKQRRFADEYITTGNIYKSAIIAGYSENYAKTSAGKLLDNIRVKAYIDKRLDQLKKDSIAEQDEILQYLTSVMRGQTEDEQLLVVGDGDFGSSVERHSRRSDTAARTKAAELLGKRYAMWTDKVDQTNTNIEIVIGEDDE